MKITKLLLMALSIVLITSCSSSNSPSDSNEIKLLENAKYSIDSLLYSIWDYSDANISEIVNNDFDEIKIREILNSTLDRYKELYEVVYVDSLGVLKYAEPEQYHSSEGTDISEQSHVKQLFETKQRTLSNIFPLVEGYYAIVMESPIMKNDKVAGSISPIFKPEDLINSLINEIHNAGVDDFWVMDTNALIVYDTDPAQIGRNIYTDPLYADYPELHEASKTIIAGESGKTKYSFLNKEKNLVVTKDVWWRTSDYYGTKWKFCIVKEEK